MDVGGTGRELRELAGDVAARRANELSPFNQQRLADLGELILLAANMADDFDGIAESKQELTQELADDMFEDLLYREFPDGPAPATD